MCKFLIYYNTPNFSMRLIGSFMLMKQSETADLENIKYSSVTPCKVNYTLICFP